MTTEVFGRLSDGESIHRLHINAGAISVALLTRGAVLNDVRLESIPYSLTVGSPDIAAYEGKMGSAGATCGPVVNRIAGAKAEIDGKTYDFATNFLGKHTLHGGDAAMHRRTWEIAETDDGSATLQIRQADGDGGFPGNRLFTARFEVLPPATLRLTLSAETDAPTVVNLANHSYWRLDDAPTVAGHILKLAAAEYTPATEDLIPTGEIAPVDGTRFDYREGRVLEGGAEGLIDNNFCLSRGREPLRPVAWLTGQSGVTMEMATTEPGIQVYDGHGLEQAPYVLHDGTTARGYCGVALEAQYWPDAPNHPNFPSIVLRPGEPWKQVTEWRFSAG
ncbi:aldose epimerase family protein [Pseudoruegeria sp. HB172150]|uniref:aldose epimerase family protein n=1 Tax=Pseudoruegeria sp. HB172150 TaxID=2721164 RepID=UPI001552F6B5|nr:aldose epimerase family protein [Pseudoruegeria sp. HB172150]